MSPPKLKRRSRVQSLSASPVRMLESELLDLRRELRETIRAYAARLEVQLAESVAALRSNEGPDELPRERAHQLRDLTAMVRKRKVKPEKGRRKDLRKLDSLITDVHLFLPDQQAPKR